VNTNGDGLTIAGAGPQILTGSISGSGSLTQNGAGLLVLSGTNNFSGGTTLNSGTLALNSAAAPGAGTLALLGGMLTNTSGWAITLINNNPLSVASLTFSGTSGINLGNGAASFNTSASGTITLNASAPLTIGGTISSSTSTDSNTLNLAGTGSLVFTGGSNGTPSVIGDRLQVGVPGNKTGGSLNISGYFNTAHKTSLDGGWTINWTGVGTIDTAADDYVGLGLATLNVSGGVLNISPQAAQSFFVGDDGYGGTTENGQVNINGGTLNITSNTRILIGNTYNDTGGGSTSTLSIASGTFSTGTTSGLFQLGPIATASGSGVINLNSGGVLATARTISCVSSTSAGGAGTFNFNGGTLLATGSTLGMSGLSAANIGTLGAAIDSGTYSIAIAQPLVHNAAVVGADGGLTKYSAGTLTLSGTSTYNGSTTVMGGTLNITGSIAGSDAINVNAANGPAGLILGQANAISSSAPITTTGSGGNLPTIDVNQNQLLSTVDGAGTFIVGNGAELSAIHIRLSTLSIGSLSTVTISDSAAPGNTSATSALTELSNSGTLDLNDNDLIVLDTTQYSAVKNGIVAAYDGGAWDKPGITSSLARIKSGSCGLGYAQASAIGSTSFDGQTFSDAVLVKYTLLGDTQLRGTVGLGDYNTVLSNYGTSQDWIGGDFHYGGVVGIGDYDDVLNNFGARASGNLAPSLTPALTRGINPGLAKTDLLLQVNTTTGDVYVLATASAAFTGYTISDPSAHLLGGSTSPDPDKLLSVAAQSGGNSNVFETSGTYANWFKITETASQVAEGQQQNGFATHSSRDDTINIPAGGTIDFGEIYNAAAQQQDLTFDFAEAGTEPTNGPTYYGAEVDYVSAPEPTSISLLALGAEGLLARRKRSLKQANPPR
jgi:autotransporter-associated beta strand protein